MNPARKHWKRRSQVNAFLALLLGKLRESSTKPVRVLELPVLFNVSCCVTFQFCVALHLYLFSCVGVVKASRAAAAAAAARPAVDLTDDAAQYLRRHCEHLHLRVREGPEPFKKYALSVLLFERSL